MVRTWEMKFNVVLCIVVRSNATFCNTLQHLAMYLSRSLLAFTCSKIERRIYVFENRCRWMKRSGWQRMCKVESCKAAGSQSWWLFFEFGIWHLIFPVPTGTKLLVLTSFTKWPYNSEPTTRGMSLTYRVSLKCPCVSFDHFMSISMIFPCTFISFSPLYSCHQFTQVFYVFIQETTRSWTFVRWPTKPSEGNPVAAEIVLLVVSRCFHGRAPAYNMVRHATTDISWH